MTRPHATATLLAASLLLAACGGEPRQPDQSRPGTESAESAATNGDDLQLECERVRFPCSRDQIDAAVLELESRYVADISAMLDTGASYADAVEWVRRQDRVAAAEADEHEMFFRLDGGQPLSFSEILTDPDAPPVAGGFDAVLAGVVGHGTARANPQNHKRALLLDPLSRDKNSGFSLVRPSLGQLRDYRHTDGVTYAESVEVTPESFAGWNAYDAIFVATHGGLKGGSWLATGIYEPSDPDEGFADQCAGMMEGGWEADYLARCAVFDHVPTGTNTRVRFVGVVVTGDYFRETYGRTGGLESAIVYIGGCDGMNMTDIRDALAGSSSVYVGWSAVTVSPQWENATVNLMHSLIRGLPIDMAVAVVCGTPIGCRVPTTGAELKLHPDRGDPSKLRLVDVPTELRHPSRGATPIGVGPPLEDGARVPIIGTPGDGRNDEVELMVDFIGIVDPEDAGSDLVSHSGVRVASTRRGDGRVAQASDAAHRYSFTVEVNGSEIVRDNLGETRHPGASATPLDETRYRYAFKAELPFDVDPAGTSATIKVTVDPLPEGGISDYEVNLILEGPRSMCDVIEPAIGRIVSAFGVPLALDDWGAPGGSRSECVLNFEGPNPSAALYAPDLTARLSIARQPAIVRSVADAVLGYDGTVSPAPSLGADAVVIEVPHGLFADAPPIPHVLFSFGDRVYEVTGQYPDMFEIWANNPDEAGPDLDLAETPVAAIVAVAEIVRGLLGAQPLPSPQAS